MTRRPVLAVLVILALAGLVPSAVQDTPARPAPSAPAVLRAIINEASGERALQNEIHLTGVNRNRKTEDSDRLFRVGLHPGEAPRVRTRGLRDPRSAGRGRGDLGRRSGRAVDRRAGASQDRRPRRPARLPLLRQRHDRHDGRARLCGTGPPRRVLQGQGRGGQGPAGQRAALRRPGGWASRSTAQRVSSAGPRAIRSSTATRSAGAGSGSVRATGRPSASWSPNDAARSSGTPWSAAIRLSSGPWPRPNRSRTTRTS